ncbi:MAG: DUF3467 domain-containing protein [Bacteroidota bacterium]
MEEQKKTNPNQLNIELPGDLAKGVYSNLAVVSHSHSEFVLDFIQVIPGTPKAEVRARVIMTPQNTKRLMLAMKENLDKYERVHGEVRVAEKEIQIPPNFGGTTGFA